MPRALPGRTRWEEIRARGLARYVLVQGALARGVPMALAVALLLEVLEGRGLRGVLAADPGFLGRLALALALFAAGGALSAWARWKSLESAYGEDPEEPRPGA